MRQEFKISMIGELNFFLKIHIKQKSKGTFICQSKYPKELFIRFGLESAKPYSTPMRTSIKLDKDQRDEEIDWKLYRGMIGSLLCLLANRPDIVLRVEICAWFQSYPKISHLTAVKPIFGYLKDTIELGLWYPKNINFE